MFKLDKSDECRRAGVVCDCNPHAADLAHTPFRLVSENVKAPINLSIQIH